MGKRSLRSFLCDLFLGSFVLELSLGLSLGDLFFEQLQLGSFRLETFAWILSLVTLSLASSLEFFPQGLSYKSFRLGSFA